jgi:hypothetical protein
MLASPHEDNLRTKACRAYLTSEALAGFGLGIALLIHGASKTKHWPAEGLLDPYASMTALGAVSVPSSLLALAGAATKNRFVLFVYIIFSIVAVTLMVYASIVCFVCAKTSTALASTLTTYFHGVSHHFGATEVAELELGGTFCAVSAGLLSVSIACATQIAGSAWTLQKMPATLNTVALVLAGILLAIAVNADTSASTDNSRFAIASGVFDIVSCLFGFFSLAVGWPKCLRAHALSTIVLAVMGVTVAAACISAGNVRASESMCNLLAAQLGGGNSTDASPPPFPPECLVEGRLSSDRLLLIGCYALVASLTNFAEVAFIVRDWSSDAKPPESKVTPLARLAYTEFVGETRDSDGSGTIAHSLPSREDNP